MATKDEILTRFKVDISDLKAKMQEATRTITLANSEFKAISSSMDDWEKNIDGLSAKQDQLTAVLKSQEDKLSLLNEKYKKTCEVFGDTSAEAQKVKIEINNQQTAINGTKKELEQYSAKLNDAKNNEEILNNTIQHQKSTLTELTSKYDAVVKKEGANSQSAKDLKSQIDKLNTELQDNEKQLNNVKANSKNAGNGIEYFQKESKKASQAIGVANSEFKATASTMDDWEKDIKGLSAKHKQLTTTLKNQDKILESLNSEYKLICKESGKNSDQAQKLKIKINDQQTAINNTKKELEKYTTKLKDASKDESILTNTIKNQKSKLAELKTQYAQVIKSQGSNSQSAKTLKSQIDKLNTELTDNEKQLKKVQNNSKLTSSVMKLFGDSATQVGTKTKDAGDKVKQLGDKSKQAKTGLKEAGDATKKAGDEAKNSSGKFDVMKVALGNLVAQGITKAIQSIRQLVNECTDIGKTFEYTNAQVESLLASKSSDINADMGELKDSARSIALDSLYSAEEISSAYKYMGVAGWNAAEMLDAVNPVLNLASSNSMDLARCCDIVTDYLTAFGLESKDVARFCDVLAQTSRNSNTDVDKLGESFKYVAPLAGSLGYSIEDVSIALGLMANMGTKESTAGTALRSLLTNLVSPTEEVSESIRMLGITLNDGEGNFSSFMEVMQKIREGFNGLGDKSEEFRKNIVALEKSFEDGSISEEEYNEKLEDMIYSSYNSEQALKAMAAANLSGKRALSGLLAIANASDEDFNALTESIYNSAGAAQQMADIQIDTLLGDQKKRDHAWDELKLKISDTLYDTNRSFTQWQTNTLIPFVESVAIGFSEKVIPKLNEFKDVVTNAFETGAKAVGDFFNSEQFSDFTNNLNEIKDNTIQTLTNKFGELKTKASEFANSEEVKNYFSEFKRIISEETSPAIDDLKTSIANFAKDGSGLFGTLTESAGELGNTLSESIGGWVKDQGPAKLISDMLYGISKIVEIVIIRIGTVFKVVDGVFKKLKESPAIAMLGVALKDLKDAFARLGEAVAPIIKKLLDFFSSKDLANGEASVAIGVITKAFEILSVVLSVVVEAISWVVDGLAIFFENIVNLPQTLSDIGTGISELFGLLVESVVDKFNEIKKNVSDFFSNIGETVTNAIGEFVASITEFFNNVVDFFTHLPENIGYAIGYIAGTIYKFITEDIPNFINSVVNFFTELPGKVQQFVADFIETSKQKFDEWKKSIIETFENVATSIIDWIKDIPNKIKQGLDNIKKKFTDWKDSTKKTVTTTVSDVNKSVSFWITSLPQRAWTAIKNLKDTIINAVKDLPSTFLNLGKSIIDGLWNGIKGGASWLWDQITGFGEGIVSGFKDALGIHSPSRVMRDEIGKYIPLGLAEGIQKAKASVYKAMDDISDGLSINVSANGRGNTQAVEGQNNVTYNFYQTNNSPKALSRLEIYRNTKRQLAFATI